MALCNIVNSNRTTEDAPLSNDSLLSPDTPEAIEPTTVTLDYAPRAVFLPLHNRKQRWSCCVAHRRCGKTVAAVMELVRGAANDRSGNGRFAYIGPTYQQVKDIAWQYLKQFTSPIPGIRTHETELRVDFPNGARVRLYGAENYDRLRGIYLDGLVCDEYGDMEPRAWSEVLRPALSDRKGWALFIGTPRGDNHFREIWELSQKDPAWFGMSLPVSKTLILPEEELSDARKSMTPEQYAAEYECSFTAPVVGAYYGDEMTMAEKEGRITRVPYDKAVRVHTAWDLGIGDSTAIWFMQLVGKEVHVIDFLENTGKGLDWYARELQQKPYVYGSHIVPHDAPARELGTGKTRLEVLRQLGILGNICVDHKVDDGINAARMFLNKCWFDAEACKPGVAALRQYRREWDARKKVFNNRPLHDWASHAADAFRYLAMGSPQQDSWSKKIDYTQKWIV